MRMLLLMATAGMLIAAAGRLVSAGAPKEDAELKRLQGTWVAAKGGAYKGKEEPEEDIKRAAHRWVIKGDKLSWYTALSPILKATIKLDPGKKLKALDLSFTRDGKEVVGKCIYQLEGDTLKVCYDDKGERPAAFKTRADAPSLKLYVFKREK
jgi:uncharacterized protein (TIGR03067 family)